MKHNVIHGLQFCDEKLLCKDLLVVGLRKLFAKPCDHPGMLCFGIGVRECVPFPTVVAPAGDARPEVCVLFVRHAREERENADVGRRNFRRPAGGGGGHSRPAIYLHHSDQSDASTMFRALSSMYLSSRESAVSDRTMGIVGILLCLSAVVNVA